MSSIEVSKIRNNSITIFASQLISLALNIISISLAARYLGVEDFGKFNYLLAIVGISAKMLDFGFNPIIFRELSQENNNKKYIGSAFIFRAIIVLIIIGLFSFVGYLLRLSLLEISLIAILSFNVLLSNKFTNIRELVTIPFKVDLKMHIPMFLIILDNILLLALVLMMPFFNGGIFYFVIIYTISNLPGIAILSFFLLKQYNIKFKFDLDEIKYLFKESLPLMGFIIIAFFYVQIDILLLEHLSGSTSVGIYSSAMRLIIPLKLIPNVAVITLFSLIVKNIGSNDHNQQIVKFVTKLFFLFSVAFSAFMFVGAKDLILIIFGNKYEEAYLPLQILAFGVFFDFFSFFILDLFTAYNKQKYNFQFILIATVIVLISNILLIPSFDFVGASISRLISGFVGFLFLLYILKKQIKIKINFVSLRLIIALLVFICSVYVLSSFNFFINLFVSSIVFLALILLIKVFSVNEMKIILQFINNKKMVSILNQLYKIKE